MTDEARVEKWMMDVSETLNDRYDIIQFDDDENEYPVPNEDIAKVIAHHAAPSVTLDSNKVTELQDALKKCVDESASARLVIHATGNIQVEQAQEMIDSFADLIASRIKFIASDAFLRIAVERTMSPESHA